MGEEIDAMGTSPELSKPMNLGVQRQAKAKCGIDFGGTTTEVDVQALDGTGRVGHVLVDTYQAKPGEPVDSILKGSAGSTVFGVLKACHAGGLQLSEVSAIGSGVPGSIDPDTGNIVMVNVTGKEPVDYAGLLKQTLSDPGLMRDAMHHAGIPASEYESLIPGQGIAGDAHLRIGNDADVAAVADYTTAEKIVEIKKGSGIAGKLEEGEMRLVLTLGTGIGGGWAVHNNGVDQLYEGAHNTIEAGHTTVPVEHDLQAALPVCGCGLNVEGEMCIERLASVTAQTDLLRVMVGDAIMGGMEGDKDVDALFDATLEWTEGKLSEEIPDDRRAALVESRDAIGRILSIDPSKGGPEAVSRGVDVHTFPRTERAEMVDSIVFDAATADRLAQGAGPQSIVAADAMDYSGRMLGKALRSIIRLTNPAEIVLIGGGANTFKYEHDEAEADPQRAWSMNPFVHGMLEELLGNTPDTWGSIQSTRIIAPFGDNWGANGSGNLAKREYEMGK